MVRKGVPGVGIAVVHNLRGGIAPPYGGSHIRPGFGLPRGHKPVLPACIRPIWDAPELIDVAEDETLNLPVNGIGYGRVIPDKQYLVIVGRGVLPGPGGSQGNTGSQANAGCTGPHGLDKISSVCIHGCQVE